MNIFLSNRKKHRFLVFGVVFISLALFNCKKESKNQVGDTPLWLSDLSIPIIPYNYENPNLPDFFNSRQILVSDNTPTSNPISNWGATLGRALFYDKRLSINNTISCGSCHKQNIGFSDDARFSKGFNQEETSRHSMGLVNSRYYFRGSFFWDERAKTLEEQVLQPIKDHIEMGMTIDLVISRLNETNYYSQLFELAFGNKKIDSVQISKALSQFVRSLVSYRSKYDEGRKFSSSATQPFYNFTESENRGKSIFMNSGELSCSGCHITDLFIGDNPRNNGMKISSDSGVGAITQNPVDYFAFKVPSLKNISIRPPYMHDGSFSTLEEVIDHYSDNIAEHAYLDPHFRKPNGETLQFNLTNEEKNDLINFLNTLTDEKMIKDDKFSNPFF